MLKIGESSGLPLTCLLCGSCTVHSYCQVHTSGCVHRQGVGRGQSQHSRSCPKYRLPTNAGKAPNHKTFTYNMANRACCILISEHGVCLSVLLCDHAAHPFPAFFSVHRRDQESKCNRGGEGGVINWLASGKFWCGLHCWFTASISFISFLFLFSSNSQLKIRWKINNKPSTLLGPTSLILWSLAS